MKKQREARNLSFLYIKLLGLTLIVPFILGIVQGILGVALPVWELTIVTDAVLVLTAMFYIERQGENILANFNFRRINGTTILWTLLLGILTMQIGTFFNLLSQLFVPNELVMNSGVIFQDSLLISMIETAIAAPIFEEILFRGVFFNRYQRVTSPVKAILMSSLLFGLMHLNFNQFCYAFVIGLMLALVNYASGSTYTSVIVHSVINFYGVMMINLAEKFAEEAGDDLAALAEETRIGAEFLPMLVRSFLTACVAGICAAIVLKKIAKSEGNYDKFMALFSREKKEKDPEEEPDAKLFDIWMLIAIGTVLLLMFGIATL